MQNINWKDVDDDPIEALSTDDAALDGSSVSPDAGSVWQLLPGEKLLESFPGVRMQFRGMNLRRDGYLHVSNFRVAFVYLAVR